MSYISVIPCGYWNKAKNSSTCSPMRPEVTKVDTNLVSMAPACVGINFQKSCQKWFTPSGEHAKMCVHKIYIARSYSDIHNGYSIVLPKKNGLYRIAALFARLFSTGKCIASRHSQCRYFNWKYLNLKIVEYPNNHLSKQRVMLQSKIFLIQLSRFNIRDVILYLIVWRCCAKVTNFKVTAVIL